MKGKLIGEYLTIIKVITSKTSAVTVKKNASEGNQPWEVWCYSHYFVLYLQKKNYSYVFLRNTQYHLHNLDKMFDIRPFSLRTGVVHVNEKQNKRMHIVHVYVIHNFEW